MASIQRRGKGSFRIQFVDKDGNRKSISLSRTNLKNVQNVATRIEAINAANRAGHPVDGATADWLHGVGDVLAKKLAEAGLIEPRNIYTLFDFIDEHFKNQTDWKSRTRARHEVTKNYLLEHFDRSTLLRDVTEADADAFARFLKEKESIKSEATRAKHVSNARSYFRAAIRRRIIRDNPFVGIRISKVGNIKKHYVTQEEAKAVLDACPNVQWRMIFALSRFGGVRIVSEIEKLEWDHILWDQGKVLIHSPKTEHHPGKDKRFVPLFPELREHLAEGLELAEPNSKYVITTSRKGKSLSAEYIRKRMAIIVQRAGIVPWAKLFNSCRSTRETELEREFSIFTVCQWLGNSPRTFKDNYHQTTEDDFKKAAVETATVKVVHEMVQQPATDINKQEQPIDAEDVRALCLAMGVNDDALIEKAQLFLEGFEPPIHSL